MPTTYAIPNGRTVMDATTWTGNGASSVTVTNSAGFKPDFVWAKNRTFAVSHTLYDSVRGAGSNKALCSDQTLAEGGGNQSTYGYLSAFNSNGFTGVDGSGSPNYYFNGSGYNYVGWQWQAGQGTTSSNTSGSITSTVSVNASAGFSIVTYTGTGSAGTIGHGLGVTPSMIIIKSRSTAGTDWPVYHSSLGATGILALDSTIAFTVISTPWNNTAPTSSVFTVGTSGDTNGSTRTYVAYCWAQVAGFSQFGSYTGNGSTDGPFIYLGFRPKFILIKKSSNLGEWIIWDTTRSPSNFVGPFLLAESSAAEGASAEYLDLLSNGFKLRTTNSTLNASGQTSIYMAFAENPFKYANAR